MFDETPLDWTDLDLKAFIPHAAPAFVRDWRCQLVYRCLDARGRHPVFAGRGFGDGEKSGFPVARMCDRRPAARRAQAPKNPARL